eukprot:gene4742-2447_t
MPHAAIVSAEAQHAVHSDGVQHPTVPLGAANRN